ncbi:hypothetical protein [Nocardioides sp. SR21]|uniref:hypothetical protein n=1 Tax=Nocardioides sp. SR21 TaxID=2919501 RepID=UPI001FA98179|nr:hypothetical protein [Nocardioides sp. SR21]
MSRPQIIVNVAPALQRRGVVTDTGIAFLVYAGASGPSTPTRCLSAADALAASVPAGQAAWVGDALTQGAPVVYVLRAAAANAAAVTESEWDAALAKLTVDLGPGQVLIPGVATSAAYEALLTHANATGRTVLLDGASNASASTLTTAAAGLAAADGAERAALIAGWATVPATGGGTRDIPGSVIAAGLAARGDARVGHTNHAPILTHDGGAGVVVGGTAVTTAYTDAETDSLSAAGVSAIRMVLGRPTLVDWKSISDDDNFRQLNWGRTHMLLKNGVSALMLDFLGRQIDGRGQLFAELDGALRGYLLPLWQASALYGQEPVDAFDVDAYSPNTPTTIQDGELHAQVEVSLSPFTEKVVIDVTTTVAEGVAA